MEREKSRSLSEKGRREEVFRDSGYEAYRIERGTTELGVGGWDSSKYDHGGNSCGRAREELPARSIAAERVAAGPVGADAEVARGVF